MDVKILISRSNPKSAIYEDDEIFESKEIFDNGQINSIIKPCEFIINNLKDLFYQNGEITVTIYPNKEKNPQGFSHTVSIESLAKRCAHEKENNLRRGFTNILSGIFKDLLLKALTSKNFDIV